MVAMDEAPQIGLVSPDSELSAWALVLVCSP